MPVIHAYIEAAGHSEDIEISELTNEDLVFAYGAACECSSRRISTDRPSNEDELHDEILRRLKRRNECQLR